MVKRRRAGVGAVIGACVLLASTAANAQAPEASGDGFLFGTPRMGLTLRGGYAGASAKSEIFSFVTRELSLQRKDFSSFAVGGDFAVTIRPRLDLVLSIDTDGMKKASDYREWQDNSGKPIEQSTAFSRQSYLLGAKYSLMPKGRSLGRFAWVPARYSPWVSASVGRTFYSLTQDGDFVDFDNGNRVFRDSFKSSQWGTSAQLAGGIDWSVNQRWALTTQARYLFGKADLIEDYSDFGPIDLSGFGLSAGVTLRF
jgi:hypothetical protein